MNISKRNEGKKKNGGKGRKKEKGKRDSERE